jgi:hypothetical protein
MTSFCFYFQSYLLLFLTLNQQSWTLVWMMCLDLMWNAPALASVPAFPLECHMTLHDSVGCIVNPLPPEDLPIVGHSDKNAKVMMHVDEGIGVDGLKELDPGPSTHDGIHVDGIMEHGPSHIHYELVPPLPCHI